MPEQQRSSRGWAFVEQEQRKPTAHAFVRCGCTQLPDRPCGAQFDGPDGLCGPCRRVTPEALELTDVAWAHVGGVRPGPHGGEPLPHVSTPETAMRMP